MNIVWTIIIGFVAGLCARAIIPGRDSLGFILTTGLGIVGALIGSFIGRATGWAQPGQPVDLFGAIMGAAILLFALKAIRRTA